jgi:hypothetical protein
MSAFVSEPGGTACFWLANLPSRLVLQRPRDGVMVFNYCCTSVRRTIRTTCPTRRYQSTLAGLGAVNARDAMPVGGTIKIATGNVNLDKKYAKHHPPVVPGTTFKTYLPRVDSQEALTAPVLAKSHPCCYTWSGHPSFLKYSLIRAPISITDISARNAKVAP